MAFTPPPPKSDVAVAHLGSMLASILLDMQRMQASASYTLQDNPVLRRFVLYDIDVIDDDTLYQVCFESPGPVHRDSALTLLRARVFFACCVRGASCPRQPNSGTKLEKARRPCPNALASTLQPATPLLTGHLARAQIAGRQCTRKLTQSSGGRRADGRRSGRARTFLRAKEARSSSLPDMYEDLVRLNGNKTPPQQ